MFSRSRFTTSITSRWQKELPWQRTLRAETHEKRSRSNRTTSPIKRRPGQEFRIGRRCCCFYLTPYKRYLFDTSASIAARHQCPRRACGRQKRYENIVVARVHRLFTRKVQTYCSSSSCLFLLLLLSSGKTK